MNLNNSFFKIIMFLSVFSLIVSCKEQANTKKKYKTSVTFRNYGRYKY